MLQVQNIHHIQDITASMPMYEFHTEIKGLAYVIDKGGKYGYKVIRVPHKQVLELFPYEEYTHRDAHYVNGNGDIVLAIEVRRV